jgi:hypothetical protein
MLPLLVLALFARDARAAEVELAPFAGIQFGGHVDSPVYGGSFSLDESVDFGATLDIAIDEVWRVEVLYSRQESELRRRGGLPPVFPLTVERYMVGIMEELESDSAVRFFGVGLVGATRLIPPDFDGGGELRFAAGLSLGAKVRASKRLGFRFEARAFYTVFDSDGTILCGAGTCLFDFDGSGLWQGDVTGGLVLRF